MAALTKHTASSIANHLKHNTRGFEVNAEANNRNIYKEKTCENYSLPLPQKGEISFDKIPVLKAKESQKYYKERMAEIYHMKRSDLVASIEWCITLPKELSDAPEEIKEKFFQESFSFLCKKYGSENCIQVVVHKDEGILNETGERVYGSDHMHAMFIPVTKVTITDPKRTESLYSEKLNCKGLVNQKHLKTFHSDFQKHIDESGLVCKVHSGVTAGKNKTVDELKIESKELIKANERINELQKENQTLRNKIVSLENEIKQLNSRNKDVVIGWGESTDSGWGTSSVSW